MQAFRPEISADQFAFQISNRFGIELALRHRSTMGRQRRRRSRAPPLKRCHQLRLVCCHSCRARGGFGMTPEDARPPPLSRWADAGSRQASRIAGASRPKGHAPDYFDALRFGLPRAPRNTTSTAIQRAALCWGVIARHWRCSASCSSRVKSANAIGPWSKAGPGR